MRIPTASTARPAPPTALAGIGRIADGLGTLPGRMATGAALGAGQDALLNGGNVNGLDILTGAIGGAAAPGRRKELGLTQAETAGRCDLDQAKISRIEGSDAVPTLTLPYKLSKGLEATLRVDIDFDDEEPKITPTPHEHTAA
jgi:DNA-binding XRE family transcriptional regulator